jgi:hypothetical protein
MQGRGDPSGMCIAHRNRDYAEFQKLGIKIFRVPEKDTERMARVISVIFPSCLDFTALS